MKSKVLFSLVIISTFVTYHAHGMYCLTQAAARMATRRLAAQKFRMPQFTTQRFRIPQQSLQWRRMCTEQRQKNKKSNEMGNIVGELIYEFYKMSFLMGITVIVVAPPLVGCMKMLEDKTELFGAQNGNKEDNITKNKITS